MKITVEFGQKENLPEGNQELRDQIREIIIALEELEDEARDKDDPADVEWMLVEKLEEAIARLEDAMGYA